MEQVSYGPPHVYMVPHMWSVSMSYMTLMVLHTIYEIGIVWSPTWMYGPPTGEVSSCLIWLLWSPYILYGIGIIWSPTCMYGPPTCTIWLMIPHTLYGIGMLWSLLPYMEQVWYGPPTCTYGPPTSEVSSCLIWLLWSPYLIWNRYDMVPPHVYMVPHMWSVLMSYMIYGPPYHIWNRCHGPPNMYDMMPMIYGPPYLIWNRYLMVPITLWNRYHMVPHIYIVPPHVKCLHVLYDSYGPPYHIWNRYCMVPHMDVGPPTYYMTLMVPYLIWNRYLMVPLPYMEQISYCPPYVCMVPPHLKCLHVMYDSWSPHTLYGIGILWSPLPYMEQVLYGSPTCEVSPCLIWLLWFPYTWYGIGIIWSPHMYVWSPTCTIWLLWTPYLIWNRYLMAPYLIWNGYGMVPHMWSVFMSYMTYSPPYLIWNRYMVPHMYIWYPHMYDIMPMIYGPHTLYGIHILWSPLTLYGTGIVWSPTCEVSPCHISLLQSPIPYME